jgi:negative regulator of genetic competence, sporulation and motility
MLKKEEFEALINKVKDSIDETTKALISEDLLSIIAGFNEAYDLVESAESEIAQLKADKDELLKVNGKLFQKIGFDKEEEKEQTPEETPEEEIEIEDIIDEKGEIIDE